MPADVYNMLPQRPATSLVELLIAYTETPDCVDHGANGTPYIDLEPLAEFAELKTVGAMANRLPRAITDGNWLRLADLPYLIGTLANTERTKLRVRKTKQARAILSRYKAAHADPHENPLGYLMANFESLW